MNSTRLDKACNWAQCMVDQLYCSGCVTLFGGGRGDEDVHHLETLLTFVKLVREKPWIINMFDYHEEMKVPRGGGMQSRMGDGEE